MHRSWWEGMEKIFTPDWDVHEVEKKIRKSFTEGVDVCLGS